MWSSFCKVPNRAERRRRLFQKKPHVRAQTEKLQCIIAMIAMIEIGMLAAQRYMYNIASRIDFTQGFRKNHAHVNFLAFSRRIACPLEKIIPRIIF